MLNKVTSCSFLDCSFTQIWFCCAKYLNLHNDKIECYGTDSVV